MNEIAFYGGLVLVVVGLLLWVFRVGSPERNIIKLPGGIEFELNTLAFVVMAFGVVLVIISTWISRGSTRFRQQAEHAGGSERSYVSTIRRTR
jgi:hypothetical protein